MSSETGSHAPDTPIPLDESRISSLKGKIVLIKYGGNAMTNEESKENVIGDIVTLRKLGITPVVVHGGGPVIKNLLGEVGVESEFIEGHRKTDKRAMQYVEMALSGQVNSEIVKRLNRKGEKAVGISGKDGGLVTAKKRIHSIEIDGKTKEVDLGHVGDVERINTSLLQLLIDHEYIPVIAPIGVGEDMKDYNINADMFAGHMAGALNASHFVALTNVPGILGDPDNPDSLIRKFTVEKAEEEIGKIIRGGMIPKVEACLISIKEGVGTSHIINGMESHSILKTILTDEPSGTKIVSD